MESRSRPDEGFTVIEVVVAITVLVVALLGAAALFENAILVSGNTRNRVVAANLATEAMENVRGLAADPVKFVQIPNGGTTYAGAAQLVNGIQYTVQQDATLGGTNSTTSSCDTPGPTQGQILQVTETVTWPNMGGTKPVQEATTLAPPVGAYNPLSGAIGVKVFDSTGNVAPNINVQVTGPMTASQQTTSEGCAYITNLTAGTYTVTVIEGTGIGDQELALPAQTASVSIGQTSSVQFLYDRPATITATFPTTPAPATGMSLSVANTGLQPYGQFSFTPTYTPGSTVTTPNLFPYASGYTLFAGNCTDNNPLGKDTNRTPFYPTAAPVPITVTPGSPAVMPGTVPLYPLALHVQNSTAVAVNTTPTAAETTTFGAPYTAVCTNGTATGVAPQIGLTTTNLTGDSATVLPLGHWTITAKCTKPQAACPVANKVATLNVWVKPDAVYNVDATGAATTPLTQPITMVVA